LLLSWLAVAHIQVPAVAAAFWGIQPVVVAVVIEAVIRIGKKALTHGLLYPIAGAAFGGVFLFKIPFPYIVAGAALAGLLLQRSFPAVFCKGNFDPESKECPMDEDSLGNARKKPPGIAHFFKVFLVCAGLWLLVVGTLFLVFGPENSLGQIALFFTKAAFVTFGGAYAVLSYIAQVGVENGWLTAQQMLTGLGLAESTPGPLIMVTQFVGFVGAWTLPGELSPLAAGIIGALVTTYVTFLPCFFFIFAGAPYIEAMAGNQKLQAALTGVTASVVGVILNLSIWFGHKVLFPENMGFDFFALGLAGISLVLLQKFHFPIQYLVPLGALAGMAWKLL
ncbi:MAG: chromate transporter, partial [Desulfobacterales bacterium]|nr:chromate transporter [Desulfobacterales bacterium]